MFPVSLYLTIMILPVVMIYLIGILRLINFQLNFQNTGTLEAMKEGAPESGRQKDNKHHRVLRQNVRTPSSCLLRSAQGYN